VQALLRGEGVEADLIQQCARLTFPMNIGENIGEDPSATLTRAT
jgi:hypothetical protein